MSGDPNRVAGVCSGLPLGIQDLMWGTDNERVRNKSDRRILKSTARILCDMCPIQAECLAQSIIGREQHSRIGGIDVKARRLLRHRAEADGVDLDPSNPARTRNLTSWIRDHPELVREVREQSSTREGRRRRSEDQYAYRHRETVESLPFDVRVANRFTVTMPPSDPDTWVLIDTPPSQSDLIAAAVDASSLVVLVTTPGPLDLDRMWETAKAIDRPSSVLLTQTRANTVALRDAERFLTDRGLARFDATIPFKEALRRSSESGRMPSASGYGLVANELIEAFNGIE